MERKINKIFQKSNRWLVILIGIVATIIIICGGIYYSTEDTSVLELIFLSLRNTIKAFGFDPILVPSDIFSDSWGYGYYIYAITIYIAPLCTATVIWKAAHKFIALHMKQVKYHNSEVILVFGYNDKVRNLIQEESASSNFVYHIFTTETVSDNVELELIRKRAIIHTGDFTENASDKLIKILPDNKMQLVKKVMLFEEIGVKNIGIFFSLSKYFENREDVTFYSYFVDDNMEKIVKNIHDELVKAEEKRKHDIQNIDVERMKLTRLFEEKPLHTCNFNNTERNNLDVHALIIGFEKLGKQAIMYILNNGVLSKTNNIRIDIVVEDKGIDEEYFNNILADSYSNIELANNALDGNVQIEFHEQKNITRDFIHAINQKSGLTYVFICMEDISKNLSALFNVNTALKGSLTPIAVALEQSRDISEYLRENKAVFKNVHMIPSDKDVLKMDVICDVKQIENQKMYHLLYSRISSNLETIVRGEAYLATPWEKLMYEKKESNRFCDDHQVVKGKFIENKDAYGQLYHSLEQCLQENLQVLLDDSQEGKESQYKKIGVVELLESVKSDVFLQELMAIEHRRWCYMSILNGWEYAQVKNQEMKQTPYLVNFDDLLEAGISEENMVACYDMVPYLKVFFV